MHHLAPSASSSGASRGGRRAIAPARARRQLARVHAALSDKGKRLPADALSPVGNLLGEGSYGQVFRGMYSAGSDEPQQVILKRVRPRVLVRF